MKKINNYLTVFLLGLLIGWLVPVVGVKVVLVIIGGIYWIVSFVGSLLDD